jgi:hypothetical protein
MIPQTNGLLRPEVAPFPLITTSGYPHPTREPLRNTASCVPMTPIHADLEHDELVLDRVCVKDDSRILHGWSMYPEYVDAADLSGDSVGLEEAIVE